MPGLYKLVSFLPEHIFVLEMYKDLLEDIGPWEVFPLIYWILVLTSI